MHVTKVRFEAFKSLYDVTCSLDRFTVITGPNGAGKSNLVDAINFLGEVYGDGLEFAVGRGGGYDNIAHRRTTRAKRPVAVSVEVEITGDDIRGLVQNYPWHGEDLSEHAKSSAFRLYYQHSFTLASTTQALVADFEVVSDILYILDRQRRPMLRIERSREEITEVETFGRKGKTAKLIGEILDPFFDPRFADFISDRRIKRTALIIEQFYYSSLLAEIKRALGGTRVFQLSPYQCRGSGVPTPNAFLERHGENLPAAASHLRSNNTKAWERVQSAMRDILPGLREIDIAYTEDRRLALQFREHGVRRPWNANEVSDGTVQCLAMFIAIFDSRYPLLVIEEPENSVHPWILRRIVDLCQDASLGKQIVMTTHSPVLLNYVEPSVIRLMSIQGGRSQIRQFLEISPELREVITEGQLSLFDAYDSGIVDEAVPLGFSEQSADARRGLDADRDNH